MVEHFPEKHPQNTPFPVLPPFVHFHQQPRKNGSFQRYSLKPPLCGSDPLGITYKLRVPLFLSVFPIFLYGKG